MSAILRRVKDGHGGGFIFWCPGCDGPHSVFVGEGPGPRWGFNGDVDRPTFTPSLMVNRGSENPGRPQCHSFIRDGQMQFLGDCSHGLAGQTVAIPEWPRPNYGGVEPC